MTSMVWSGLAAATLGLGCAGASGSDLFSQRDLTESDSGCSLPGCDSPSDGGFPDSPIPVGDASDAADVAPPKTECLVDPSFAEVPGNDCDENGDRQLTSPPCDSALPSDGNAGEFSRALGICWFMSSHGYGLLSAQYSRGYKDSSPPKNQQHGILTKFGFQTKPQEGASLAVLSSGYAREYNGSGVETFRGGRAFGGGGALPPGFPRVSSGCPAPAGTSDISAIRLTLKAPPNTKGFRFRWNYFSSEWPDNGCAADSFVAYLSAKGFNGGAPDNIAVDSHQASVSVMSLEHCTPGIAIGCKPGQGTSSCPFGEGILRGTGFEARGNYCEWESSSGGATGWRVAEGAVLPGEIFTLEMMVWDGQDGKNDSLVLLDGFEWR